MKRGVITLNFIETRRNLFESLLIRRFFRSLTLITAITLSGLIANAQNLTVSGGTTAAGNYATFTDALTAVNAVAATGPITINFNVAGYSETAPVTGFVI